MFSNLPYREQKENADNGTGEHTGRQLGVSAHLGTTAIRSIVSNRALFPVILSSISD
jgi:hypothetical protein